MLITWRQSNAKVRGIYSVAKVALCPDTGEAIAKVVQTKGVSLKGALRIFFGSTSYVEFYGGVEQRAPVKGLIST